MALLYFPPGDALGLLILLGLPPETTSKDLKRAPGKTISDKLNWILKKYKTLWGDLDEGYCWKKFHWMNL